MATQSIAAFHAVSVSMPTPYFCGSSLEQGCAASSELQAERWVVFKPDGVSLSGLTSEENTRFPSTAAIHPMAKVHIFTCMPLFYLRQRDDMHFACAFLIKLA
jgi:hypothetical protein